MVSSEIISVTAILWSLNLLSKLIEGTYKLGVTTGKFYFQHMHQFCKRSAIQLIALLVLTIQLSMEGAQIIYRNRDQIISTLNDWRNIIGQQFTLPNETKYKAITI